MGNAAAIQTTITNINNTIITDIKNSAGASSTATCVQKVDSITAGILNNCSINLTNMCNADATAMVEANIKSVVDLINKLTVEQKQAAAQILSNNLAVQTTTQNISSVVATYMQNECKAKADSDLTQYIGSILIKECYGPANGPSVAQNFIQTGWAKSNCISKLVFDTLVSATNDIRVAQEQTNVYGLLVIAVMVFFALAAVIAIVWILKGAFLVSATDQAKINLSKKDNPPFYLIYDTVVGPQ